ncbi:MAG: hypothetical protein HXY38_15475 [Chloroflexi bacterium]|nr:hypothetical protein [Chloroflexota bacterium]
MVRENDNTSTITFQYSQRVEMRFDSHAALCYAINMAAYRTKYSTTTGKESIRQLNLLCYAEQEQQVLIDLYEASDQSIRFLEWLIAIDVPPDEIIIANIAGDARIQVRRLLPLLKQLNVHLEKGYAENVFH